MTAEHDDVDLIVIGAGPAGLSAAVRAHACGLRVALIDEQHAPGGQIYRSIEASAAGGDANRLGADYAAGAGLVERFRASGATYLAQTQVWQIEPVTAERSQTAWHIFVTQDRVARRLKARRIIVAVGALERPVPFDGWTTPGVMTVGAAQVLLKASGLLPKPPFWIAGQGPLVLLYTVQLLDAGVRPQGLLLTTPPGAVSRAWPQAVRAVSALRALSKGLSLIARIKASGIPVRRGVSDLKALGMERLEAVQFVARGQSETRPAGTLLVHEGVVANTHMTMALGCDHVWDTAQHAPRPVLDDFGRTSVDGIAVAGDCGGIIGADASTVSGEIAALGAALDLGRVPTSEAANALAPLRSALRRHLHIRPLLDALYPPRQSIRTPADHVMVCRCEERTAGDIRKAISEGCLGPNQVKAFTRVGMGPCQGRMCGLTMTELVGAATGTAPGATGLLRIRPPLKPVTLGELAALAAPPSGPAPSGPAPSSTP